MVSAPWPVCLSNMATPQKTIGEETKIPVFFINGGNGNAEDTGQRASHCPSSMDKLGIVEVVAAAMRTRATTSGTAAV